MVSDIMLMVDRQSSIGCHCKIPFQVGHWRKQPLLPALRNKWPRHSCLLWISCLLCSKLRSFSYFRAKNPSGHEKAMESYWNPSLLIRRGRWIKTETQPVDGLWTREFWRLEPLSPHPSVWAVLSVPFRFLQYDQDTTASLPDSDKKFFN